MLRVLYLFWTLIAALLVTGLSFFYISGEAKHGLPLTFAAEVKDGVSGGEILLKLNSWSLVLDVIFWWILFSILLIIVKNYVFESE